MDYLANGAGRLCILGDLILPEFEWELFLHPDTSLYNSAADLVCNHGLTQVVCEPTRADNILDIVLCSDVLSCDDICCLPPLGSSDHNIVSFTLTLSFAALADNSPLPPRPNYNLADWESLSSYLSSIDWTHELCCCATATDMWTKFTDIVKIGVGRFVPNCKSPINSHTRRYYPARIRRLYASKLRSWKLYKTFHTAELLEKYKRLSKACLGSLKHFQNNFENKLVDGGNIGAFL